MKEIEFEFGRWGIMVITGKFRVQRETAIDGSGFAHSQPSQLYLFITTQPTTKLSRYAGTIP